jgi:hypothetical protein
MFPLPEINWGLLPWAERPPVSLSAHQCRVAEAMEQLGMVFDTRKEDQGKGKGKGKGKGADVEVASASAEGGESQYQAATNAVTPVSAVSSASPFVLKVRETCLASSYEINTF